MIMKFNSLNRYETPSLTLCNPSSVYNDGCLTMAIGILANTEAEEILFNFNAMSELNLRVNRVTYDDPNDNLHSYNLYTAIQNRRLIFVEGIGYFMITEVSDESCDGVQYKDIHATSIECEIQLKTIPYIEDGTYRFLSVGETEGILNRIVSVLPQWKIGYVEESIAKKYRTFSDTDVSLNCLGFLLDNLQDAYECIILFDIKNRLIEVYDQETYVKKTDIHITKNDLINSISITENSSDIYTAINVVGGDNITIAAINPLGTNVIYDFSHYLSWMTPRLGHKVRTWQNKVQNKREGYYNTNLLYYTHRDEAASYEMEIEKLDTQITMYSRCRENIIAEADTTLVGDYNTVIIQAGGEPIKTYEEIADTLSEIDRLISACKDKKSVVEADLSKVKSVISSLQEEIDSVHSELAITSFFSQEEYDELYSYIYEGSYNDEHITITDIMTYGEKFEQMKVLYGRAELMLKKMSTPTQEFTVDAESFIFSKEFEYWSSQLETGCLIQVELDQDDIASLFLTSITVNYDDCTMGMTYGNRFNKFDIKSLFDKVLGNISKSANTLTYLKDTVSPLRNGELDKVKNDLQASKDLTMGTALASLSEEIVLDGSGLTGKKLLENGRYDPRQIKVMSRSIVFTDDAWESCKAAIGEISFGNGEVAYGINADVIIGELVAGNNLKIVDETGKDIFTVVDTKITSTISDVNGRITNLEQDANNIDIRIQALENSEDGITSITTSTGYTFDENGLNISRDGEEVRNELDHTGMYVSRDDEEILSATGDGVTTTNLSAKDFLTIGANCRLEDYTNSSGERRTACYYIGT